MIKFFRHIKKSLLEQNKMGKYFKYAIGEIILVVIGILIALGINDWKTSLDNKKIENTYYCNILNDLITDKEQINNIIKEEKKAIASGKEFIQNLHSLKYTKDELLQKYILALRSPSYVQTKATYTDLLSSGNLDLLKNTILKEKLIKLQSDLGSLSSRLQVNRHYKLERFMRMDNNVEFGWQSPSISKGLNLDKDFIQLLPQINWHLDKNHPIFQKAQDITFSSMTISNRAIELYKQMNALINPLIQELENSCDIQ